MDPSSLKEHQASALMTLISRLWPATPRKTRGTTFQAALATYFTGDDAADAETAARLRAAAARPTPPLPPSLPAPPAPTPSLAPPALTPSTSADAPPALSAPPLFPGARAPAPTPPVATFAAPASVPGPARPPRFIAAANDSLAARDLPFGALFPPADETDLSTGVAALSVTPVHNLQAVQRYYNFDANKYHGADTESLYRHVSSFRCLCCRLGIHPSDHASCLPASLGASRYNLPSLCHDNPSKTETQLWTLIQQRVYTPARMSRLRTVWQSTSLLSFPRLPGESDVQHFGRLVEFLKQLQEPLGATYEHPLSLRDSFLDAINTEPYWADLVARNLPSVDALADVVELLLEARRTFGAPAPTTAPDTAPLLPPAPAFPASLDNDPALPPPRADPVTGDTCVFFSDPDPADPAAVYWSMRQFRRGAPSPYATRRWTPQRPRGPGPSARCNSCGSPDHWAASCSRRSAPPRSPSPPPRDTVFPLRPRRPARPASVHFADSPALATDDPPAEAPASPPDHGPTAAAYDLSHLDLYYIYALEAGLRASPLPSSAIVDTGSPPDVVGEGWLNRHRPAISHPLRPTPSRIRFGKDTPLVLGTVGLILCVSDSRGRNHTLPLPDVLVVASDHIPLIVGLQTCATHRLVIDPGAATISARDTDISFRCTLSNGHLCLPHPSSPPSPYYSTAEMAKTHRQFGHTGADKVVAAFPPGTFSPQDLKLLDRVV